MQFLAGVDKARIIKGLEEAEAAYKAGGVFNLILNREIAAFAISSRQMFLGFYDGSIVCVSASVSDEEGHLSIQKLLPGLVGDRLVKAGLEHAHYPQQGSVLQMLLYCDSCLAVEARWAFPGIQENNIDLVVAEREPELFN